MTEALSLLLAGTLLLAALAKARDPRALAAAAAGLAKAVPGAPVAPLARTVPVAEAGLAVALLAGAGRAPALACALLLLVFTVVLRVLERRSIPCACFGASPARGGVGRNAALLVISGALVAVPARAVWTMPWTEFAGAATAAAGAACAWSLARELAA